MKRKEELVDSTKKILEIFKYKFKSKELDKAEELADCLNVLSKAIDEREELRNELCLYCGKYKYSHLGSCDGCKWSKE